ncbi:hypothetical protein DL96DRAFT_1625832 [Flagelloscypha sp. PMI_526]|nr:hypothetical protein DL96DRAFT_1625832 [Flagelloscypha sp. PMI_526]
MILDFVSGALGPQRNHFGEQARREEEKERQRRQEERARRERKEKEERQHRQWEEQEYRRRQWEEHERQRRQWEEQDRQRRQKEEQDREHRQREQRSSESGHRRSKRTDPPVPIDIARAEYAQRLSALRASLENPNPNRLHTFADIPWPTRILKPTVDNVTPDRVQEFFVALKKVSSQTMMEELKDARILFHPSRFMAWGVYTKLYWDVEEVEVVKLKVEEVSKKLNDLMDGQRRQAVRLVL